jgi:hypothetical protein
MVKDKWHWVIDNSFNINGVVITKIFRVIQNMQ